MVQDIGGATKRQGGQLTLQEFWENFVMYGISTNKNKNVYILFMLDVCHKKCIVYMVSLLEPIIAFCVALHMPVGCEFNFGC